MVLYLLAGLFIVYLITFIAFSKEKHKKIWTLAFMGSIAFMGFILLLLTYTHTSGISILKLDEYYALYLNAYIVLLLGIVNLWLYKVEIYHLLKGKKEG